MSMCARAFMRDPFLSPFSHPPCLAVIVLSLPISIRASTSWIASAFSSKENLTKPWAKYGQEKKTPRREREREGCSVVVEKKSVVWLKEECLCVGLFVFVCVCVCVCVCVGGGLDGWMCSGR